MNLTRPIALTLTFAAVMIGLRASAGEFPDNWYWDRPAQHTKFEGLEAPALTVGEWVGGEYDINKMKGKIVVIDFWATWCGPCIAAMPHNTKLAKDYADQGVELIGICTSGDVNAMPTIVKDKGAQYPNAFAKGDQVAKDWPIQWYPTYAVVDREGIVRAIGLKPERVKDVIETLLGEEADADGMARIRPTWLEGDEEKRERLGKLERRADSPPALQVDNWINSEEIEIESLKGKVVVLDFWATWCGPCIRSIPKHHELMEKYGQEGLVIIGITATHGGEKVADIVKQHGIKYPVCVDVDNKTNAAYKPNGFPDYYIIDRHGNLRIADCANGSVEAAVKALLAEKVEAEEDE